MLQSGGVAGADRRDFQVSTVVTRTLLLRLALCGLAGWLAISVVSELVL